ncbi:hypothetical protein GCM10007940_40060 [Portibacter lacus]|uniref:Uncharacterized protein n=2 Tax=Portibacter lacus TaxID=1099794 RepID=A0AA37SUM9_9BACT|nr:hypothetical protein GCM10007940_40060 [Portibacter lacus]
MELMPTENQGANTSAFTDVWMFQDGRSSGVYELPRKIPVVNNGSVSGSIQAGIRDNGINSSPRIYPFVDTYNFNLTPDEGEVIPLLPIFKYLETTNFRLVDDFNGAHQFGFDEDGVDSIRIEITDEGEGLIKLQPGELIQEATALVFNEIPQDGSPVYLEIDYKGNLDLDLGLIGITGESVFKDYFVSLRSENTWKKAYINFTDLIIASGFDGYQIVIGADNSINTTEAKIYIDNIKLLHF